MNQWMGTVWTYTTCHVSPMPGPPSFACYGDGETLEWQDDVLLDFDNDVHLARWAHFNEEGTYTTTLDTTTIDSSVSSCFPMAFAGRYSPQGLSSPSTLAYYGTTSGGSVNRPINPFAPPSLCPQLAC